MKFAVIVAMALAALAASDSASAGARRSGGQGQQVSAGKTVAGGPLISRGGTRVNAGRAGAVSPTTQGIIMRDGGVCDPIRHMGC